MKLVCQGIEKLEPERDRQTHRVTDATENITAPAFVQPLS